VLLFVGVEVGWFLLSGADLSAVVTCMPSVLLFVSNKIGNIFCVARACRLTRSAPSFSSPRATNLSAVVTSTSPVLRFVLIQSLQCFPSGAIWCAG
jgi:hypothetical protein